MPRGRRPLPRGVYSFEDLNLVPPAELVLDTSFVVEALVPTQRLHEAARAFLGTLIGAKTTLYFNRLLELELMDTAFRLAIEERHGRRNQQQLRRDGRVRRRAGRLLREVLTAWDLTLSLFSFVRVETDDVAPFVPELMASYGLRSYDAVHAATALYAEVPAMAATDVGFAAMPHTALSIYTNTARVAACRRHRGRG